MRALRSLRSCSPKLDVLARVLDSTSLALASDHQASAFESTILVVVEDLFQSNVPRHCSSGTDLHGVVTLREYVETVAPLPTVDVMAVTVVRMTVTRQYLNKAHSVRHIENQRKKLRRHKLKGP